MTIAWTAADAADLTESRLLPRYVDGYAGITPWPASSSLHGTIKASLNQWVRRAPGSNDTRRSQIFGSAGGRSECVSQI